MLEFSDAPYHFYEPKPSRFVSGVARLVNQHLVLPGPNHRIKALTLSGEIDALKAEQAKGARLLFAINHPSHSDPQIVTEIHRRLGIPSCFMAAYDVFHRGKATAWFMQRLGNFSIDREGSDRKAMSTAIDILKEGRQALNIFPEGNVYLTNDRVTPFLDGTAFIAAKAQGSLKDTPLTIIPISLKFTHLTTPRDTITERLLQLGADAEYAFPKGSRSDPLGAVLGLGQHIVRRYLQNTGLADAQLHEDSASFCQEQYDEALLQKSGPLFRQLASFACHLLDDLETELDLPTDKNTALVERVRKVRTKIHQMRTDGKTEPHPEIDGLADKAILAFRIHGHLTPYLTEHPSIDRYDETVERIAEDFYSKAMPRTGPRRAMAHLGSPISVGSHLEAAEGKARRAVQSLTREMEATIQSGVDHLNSTNDAPGATIIERG